MKMGFVGSLAIVAGVVFVVAVGGVLLLMWSNKGPSVQPQSSPQPQTEAPVPALPPAPAITTNPKTGAPQYVRDCNGAFAEAKNIGVLPGYATLDAVPPRPGNSGENLCSASTPSSHYDVTYFTTCPGGGDSCPVLAHVTQDNQYVLFHRD